MTSCSRSASAPGLSDVAGRGRRRKPIHQRQPVEAFAQAARKIVVPALATQSAPLSDLRHAHAMDQDVMHQRRSVRTKLALSAVEPKHRLALALRNRLARLSAIDIFARRVDSAGPALGSFPIVLKGPAGPILRLVQLMMRMQPRQRVVSDSGQ